ncbi:Putative type-1 restriction enzyme specificity protein [Saezia sanguinis]|uniref:Type-1 restriction enzyme specificity protein n=1 Tax=Saezia sanguinis TaxID=1965230 RepID=A0A433SB84_9BURK|nr:restriction endonuclease subunit S [Saezia sanguinis]RUS65991.1 Putative type-1 restriction enzyme specificity protein [Saezia sanguinis]
MSEWLEDTLGNYVAIQTGPFGSLLHASDYVPAGIPSIMPVNIGSARNIVQDKICHISKSDANRLEKYLVHKNDIIYSRRGDVEKCALITERENGWLCGTGCLRIRIHNKKLDSIFCSYYLSTDTVKSWVSANAVGTTMPNLNSSILNRLPILVPSLSEQKAIASVLSSLDNKIDLLHRQNKTLESMAETLFRQWFIEFPQEHWEEKSLSQIATFTNGLACQKFPAVIGEESLPVLKIKELNSGVTNDTDMATANVKPEYVVNHGDVIFAWSASLMVKIWSGPNCVLNQHLFNVRSNKYPKWFYYEWCKFHLREFISISQSHATTMGHIKRKDLDEAMVKIPSDSELNVMSVQIEPLLNQRIEKLKQIQALEKLRDTLLPKLMSGEVRVQYAEEAIESIA